MGGMGRFGKVSAGFSARFIKTRPREAKKRKDILYNNYTTWLENGHEQTHEKLEKYARKPIHMFKGELSKLYAGQRRKVKDISGEFVQENVWDISVKKIPANFVKMYRKRPVKFQ